MFQKQPNMGTILIVDDTPDNLRLLSSMLSDHGYKVRPAPSGAHALATIRKEAPDLILLDIMMPEVDGYEVCRTLKADKQTCDIPVIFLSALHEVEGKMKAFEAGAVDYITKPFHEKEVMVRVETHLKISCLQQKLLTEKNRYKSLVEATFEAIIIHSDTIIVDVNTEAARLFGRNVGELVGTDLKQLLVKEIYQSVLSGQTAPIEGVLIGKNKISASVEVRTKRLALEDQQVSVTAIRDLTREKTIELEKQQLIEENRVLKLTTQDRYKFKDIIGRSPAMQKVYELIYKATAVKYHVVISGESGTGKELVAQTIHTLRYTGNEPFVTVNCGAVSESLFEREFFGHRKGSFTGAVRDEPGYLDAAHKGTLFLDELGELPLAMQVKLLRVLESGEYIPVGDVVAKKANIRIVAATNKDLAKLVRQGKFREDLFYRIQVIEIALPPLRERREDIRLLMEHIFVRNNAAEKIADLPTKFGDMLYHYDWPGNVRELMNTIQRYLATDLATLPGQSQMNSEKDSWPTTGLYVAVDSLELRIIREALQQTKWHRGKTAELLQIPRRSLQRKMQKYDLRTPS